MKSISKEHSAHQQDAEDKKCLQAIESLIKTSTYREQGYIMLKEFDLDIVTTSNLLLYYFVHARYHHYSHKATNETSHLEMENDFLDLLFDKAYQEEVRPKEGRYYFSRAHVKYKLSAFANDESHKDYLLKKSSSLVERSLRFDPTNDSFLWLQHELSSVA